MSKQEGDLEKFLKNVDEISTLVEELNSSSECCQRKAIENADRLIASWKQEEPCRTRLNRTVINTKTSQQATPPTDLKNDSEISSEDFMRILEKDAEDRAERRKKNEELAYELKAKGNEAFARGDYEAAVLHYTEGLQKLRDMPALYTNRAQAYIKLQKFKEAISDCDWALRCDEKCVKALIHMGRAHQALKNYTEARGCYQRILDIEPGRAALVKQYLTQVDLEEKKELQEKRSRDEFEMGKEEALTVHLLLEKLKKPEQMIMYYCGGLELLSQAITDCTGQTLFRLNDGFGVISGNDAVRRCLCQSSAAALSEELCVSVLKLWSAVCRANEENQRLLLQGSLEQECVVQLLASGGAGVRSQCLELLCVFTQDQHGRRLLIGLPDLHVLVKSLMKCLCDEDPSAERALSVLGALAAEERFRALLREDFAALFVPPFVRYLERCSHREYRDVLGALLGLLIKLSARPVPPVQDYAVPISCRCLALLNHPDGHIITRSTGVLSMVLPQSQDATQDAVKGGIVKKILKLLKGSGQTTTRYCIKTLAVCTATSQQAREELVNLDKGLRTLRRLVGGAGEVEAGNAALCLGHCLDVPGVAAALLGTDVVLLLLRHAAGDAGSAGNAGNGRKSGSAQQNAAIALGKLCEAEPRHMVKLRELHGLEILHSCLKQTA
ncbi:tetratricopeptide repeat protein 12 isoform X2 [Anguilla anguilla]|uniref:tetratricopeptide repeat protein 12 isoform X2 n=1 Tax=Anguilla anguilla TaxID=7936 RepID=UPI0015A777E4|nr:tetratricopeptide repeat protein 12 isoform X2 [Anguilla anguilla]